jgi:CheY-like chemotaxis protein
MPATLQFLVIDFHRESRYLLVKTLQRKFPDAVVHEVEEAARAVELTRTGTLAAVITHRTFDLSGAELVRQLRAADTRVPIVMVSGMDRAVDARAAGATSFLPYEEWLRIGSVVEMHMATRDALEPNPDSRSPIPEKSDSPQQQMQPDCGSPGKLPT